MALIYFVILTPISLLLRLIKKDSLKDISLTSQNAFVGAEIAIKLMLKGYQVGVIPLFDLFAGL